MNKKEKVDVGQLEEHMYKALEREIEKWGLVQAGKALPLARTWHEGQFREEDGEEKEKLPYITHPMMVACHALALGLVEDELVAAAILHDVCEDCGVAPEKLPVNAHVRRTVALLTFGRETGETKAEAKARYFRNIAGSRDAMLVKLLDRCHNLSTMVYCFEMERMERYIEETERYILPFLDSIEQYGELLNAAFLLRYQMESVVGCVKRMGGGSP